MSPSFASAFSACSILAGLLARTSLLLGCRQNAVYNLGRLAAGNFGCFRLGMEKEKNPPHQISRWSSIAPPPPPLKATRTCCSNAPRRPRCGHVGARIARRSLIRTKAERTSLLLSKIEKVEERKNFYDPRNRPLCAGVSLLIEERIPPPPPHHDRHDVGRRGPRAQGEARA